VAAALKNGRGIEQGLATNVVSLAERAGSIERKAEFMVKRPELLLCDEPTGALDAATGQKVLEALARAPGELGTTVVVITHNQAISQMANRVLTFSDGRVVGEQRNAYPRPPSDIRW
jgi:putative ABC transport system ATP-binding protein